MRHELKLRAEGAELIGGIDEVGLGAWAGPVTVAAVVLRPDARIYKVRDSKQVDEQRRMWLSERISTKCLAWSIGMSWPQEIDDVGLSEAIRRAGRRAVQGLRVNPDAFLVDGRWNFIGESARTVVRGDCESVSIASASLVAKVTRDALMAQVCGLYPDYGFGTNKGYPSPAHLWALSAFGPSPIHRRLYAPIQKLVDEGTPGRLLSMGANIDR